MAAKLYYFNGRGLGELVRITLATAGIEFTEEFMNKREQVLELLDKNRLLFQQLPLLEIDGKALVQSNAIVRYLGHKAGLCGSNADEAVLVDMYYEGARDLYKTILPIGFKSEADVLKDAKEKALPRYLPIFNKILSDQGTGYLVGSSLTIADLSLLEPLLAFVEYLGKDILDEYPALQSFYTSQTSTPAMAAYLAGPVRKRKNDETYIREVKAALAWA